MNIRKYIVLGILFFLPITAYIFFALSTNYFRPLPVLKEDVAELHNFSTLQGKPVRLKNHISILAFFGSNLEENRAYAYNIAHLIYSKNHNFDDFQLVVLLPEGTESSAEKIEENLRHIAPLDSWHFAFGETEEVVRVFNSLESGFELDQNAATPYVFIVDKERNLRGRDDDKDLGIMHGFNSANVAEINNKMKDDVKVLLAEYRRELKKYKSDRQI